MGGYYLNGTLRNRCQYEKMIDLTDDTDYWRVLVNVVLNTWIPNP